MSVYKLKRKTGNNTTEDIQLDYSTAIANKPTIPTKTSDLTNDSGYITGITSSMVTTALGYTPIKTPVLLWSGTAKTAGSTSVSGMSSYTWFIVKVQLWTGADKFFYQVVKKSQTIILYGNLEHYWENTNMQASRRELTMNSSSFTITASTTARQGAADYETNDYLAIKEVYGLI